jgi:DNA-binding NarL/FixJ family response regulator
MRARTAVLLDPHPLWLDAMQDLLADVGVEVLGRATNVNDAVALIGENRPDLLIAGLDCSSQDEEGVMGLRRAREADPGVKAVVVGDGNDPESVEAAFAAGASIYCVRTAERGDLASAIRQAFEHSIYVASNQYRGAPPEPVSEQDNGAAIELTRRELEILQLVAEGHSNSQLAKMLWVTEQTIKFHLSNIYRKLDVSNRTEASRWAQLNGILPATRVPHTSAA